MTEASRESTFCNVFVNSHASAQGIATKHKRQFRESSWVSPQSYTRTKNALAPPCLFHPPRLFPSYKVEKNLLMEKQLTWAVDPCPQICKHTSPDPPQKAKCTSILLPSLSLPFLQHTLPQAQLACSMQWLSVELPKETPEPIHRANIQTHAKLTESSMFFRGFTIKNISLYPAFPCWISGFMQLKAYHNSTWIKPNLTIVWLQTCSHMVS